MGKGSLRGWFLTNWVKVVRSVDSVKACDQGILLVLSFDCRELSRLVIKHSTCCCCRVDMRVYPELSKIPWTKAVVHEGDCLYLPYSWIHNVSQL